MTISFVAGGSAFNKYGKTSIGETLLSKATPPQPEVISTMHDTGNGKKRFQFVFTPRLTIVRWAMRGNGLLNIGRASHGGCREFVTLFSANKARPFAALRKVELILARSWNASRHFKIIFLAAGLATAGHVFAQSGPGPADPKPPADAQFSGQSEKAFNSAKSNFLANSNNADACLQFARATFDWADYATTDAKRAEVADQGIAASRKLIQLNSNSAAAHYYLALNLGELARTKSWGALKIVDQMQDEFNVTFKLDPKLDYAGADRGLGLLYLDTPGWPLSIGNKTKARQHLQKALKDALEYPENHLNLIEAELKWGDKKAAAAGLKTLADGWAAARQKFSGETWAPSWADWTKRRAAAEKKAGVRTSE